MNELQLVHSLFDQQVRFTLHHLSLLQEKHWQMKVHPWDSMFFHKLADDVNVEEVIKHTIIAERHFIFSIESLEDGSIVSLEGDEDICKEKHGGSELISCYQEVHQENLGKMSRFSQRDLEKKLIFINQPYSGIGLLWMITGHHAFHLGQIRSMYLL
jgi:hypothetical protein